MRICVFLVALIFTCSGAAAPTRTATGYLLQKKDRVYFYKRPGTLESGVEVRFLSDDAKKTICVVEKPRLPAPCPRQEFGFVMTKENGRPVMSQLYLHKSTALSRLKFKESLTTPTK